MEHSLVPLQSQTLTVRNSIEIVNQNMLHNKNEHLDNDSTRNERGEEMIMVDPGLVTGTAVDDKNVVPVNVVLQDGTVVSTIKLNAVENGTIDMQQLQNLVAAQILFNPDSEESKAISEAGGNPDNLVLQSNEASPQMFVSSPVRPLCKIELSTSEDNLITALPNLRAELQKQNVTSVKPAQRKHRGGWPKGKKRKPEKVTNGPKPPATGYLLYTIDRRAKLREEHPEMTFAEQVRIMGHEWSSKLTDKEKQTYFDLASKDKKRYISELTAYQDSDTFQQYISNKNKGEIAPYNATSPKISDEILYCSICDMYFSSHHNRSEHMLGQKHLNNITKVYEESKQKLAKQASVEEPSTPLNIDPSAIPGSACTSLTPASRSQEHSEPVDMSGFITSFIQKNEECVQELSHLRNNVHQCEKESNELLQKYHDYKDFHEVLDEDLVTLKTYGAALSAQIESLYMVPALFGVNKPL